MEIENLKNNERKNAMENKFGTLFIGGSKTIDALTDKMRSWIDLFMEDNEHFIIGDCRGTDLALQTYLNEKGYRNVTVYCSGESCRFNVGGWDEKHVETKLTKDDGYEFYRQKDLAMIRDCNGAFFIWDSTSKGTKNNIQDLKALGLPVIAYRTDLEDVRVIRRRTPSKESK